MEWLRLVNNISRILCMLSVTEMGYRFFVTHETPPLGVLYMHLMIISVLFGILMRVSQQREFRSVRICLPKIDEVVFLVCVILFSSWVFNVFSSAKVTVRPVGFSQITLPAEAIALLAPLVLYTMIAVITEIEIRSRRQTEIA